MQATGPEKSQKHQRRGFFITFEGPEAAGKTTQMQLLAQSLEDEGYSVVRTREPGGTQLGEAVRDLVKSLNTEEPLASEAELLLFGASRAQLIRHVIGPFLQAGNVVICDRFSDSTTVYQGMVRGLDMSFIERMHALTNGRIVPDVTILLDVRVETSSDRGQLRHSRQCRDAGRDRFEAEPSQFHDKVREGFLELARRCPERIKTVAGDRSAETVHADIEEIVHHALSRLQ